MFIQYDFMHRNPINFRIIYLCVSYRFIARFSKNTDTMIRDQ